MIKLIQNVVAALFKWCKYSTIFIKNEFVTIGNNIALKFSQAWLSEETCMITHTHTPKQATKIQFKCVVIMYIEHSFGFWINNFQITLNNF